MLSPVETIKLLKSQPEQTFSKGDTIFANGDEGTVMYGIIEGEIEMYINGKVIEVIQQGDVFGQGALVHDNNLRASTAIAKTDCKLAFLDRKHFLFAVQQTPMFALEVMRSYSDRHRRLKKVLDALGNM